MAGKSSRFPEGLHHRIRFRFLGRHLEALRFQLSVTFLDKAVGAQQEHFARSWLVSRAELLRASTSGQADQVILIRRQTEKAAFLSELERFLVAQHARLVAWGRDLRLRRDPGPPWVANGIRALVFAVVVPNLAVAMPSNDGASELVCNGGFEKVQGAEVSDWSITAPKRFLSPLPAQPRFAHTGRRCIRLAAGQKLTQGVSLPQGSRLCLRAWVNVVTKEPPQTSPRDSLTITLIDAHGSAIARLIATNADAHAAGNADGAYAEYVLRDLKPRRPGLFTLVVAAAGREPARTVFRLDDLSLTADVPQRDRHAEVMSEDDH